MDPIRCASSYRYVLFCFILLLITLSSLLSEKHVYAQETTQAVYLPVVTNSSAGQALPAPGPGRVAMVVVEAGNYDLYTMNPDGTARSRLTNTPSAVINLAPAWSPDGTKIAFARHNNVTGRERGIYIINADGSGETRLTNSDTRGYDHAPAWSPDGSKIAYHTSNNNQEQIVVMNSDGSGATAITAPTYRSVTPEWSPDGTQILYASTQNVEQNGRFELFVMNPDGSGKARLTVNPNADDGAGRWSPDGTRIAFASNRTGELRTYIMNRDGSSVTQIPNMPGAAVTWSPDGGRLMYAAQTTPATNTEIYVINTDGSGLTPVTSTATLLEDSPDWRP